MVFHSGSLSWHQANMSVTMRMAGRGGIDVGAARDVFLEDVVLDRAGELSRSAPCFRATATYSASRMAAVELMVIEVETSSSGMPSKSASMSAREQMATPTLPTSPRARGWSESMPICVGRSKATERPVWPCASR